MQHTKQKTKQPSATYALERGLLALCLGVLIAAFVPVPASASPPASVSSPRIVEVDVNGLVCDFCARALEKVFAKEAAVDSIAVDLDAKTVTLSLIQGGALSDAALTELIEQSGYTVVAIRRTEDDAIIDGAAQETGAEDETSADSE